MKVLKEYIDRNYISVSDLVAEIIFLLFVIWGIASWADVIAHRLDPQPVYQWWNLLTLIF